MLRKSVFSFSFFIPIIFSVCLIHGNSKSFINEERWLAPSWADTMENPSKKQPIHLKSAKRLYFNECVICHGSNGKGEGEASFGLKIPPGDLTDMFNRSQSDGAIYWKLTNGRGQMPSYSENTTELQRWQLVSYIRELQRISNLKIDKKKSNEK